MPSWRFTTEPTSLECAREEALLVLSSFDPVNNKDEYATTIAHVKTLSELIQKEQREKLSPNTVFTVAANILIALKIVNYEENNIVNTKVIPFLMKLR